MSITRFNIRVYGILINPEKEVLLVHEKMPNLHFTKFPGGGLEFGEGTRDCLKREFLEETGIEVRVKEHIYTTDFFQQSQFLPHDQLLAIYFFVEPLQWPLEISLEEKQVTVGDRTETLRFFWKAVKDFDVEQLSFPIDKIVARKVLLGQK